MKFPKWYEVAISGINTDLNQNNTKYMRLSLHFNRESLLFLIFLYINLNLKLY